MGEVGVQEYVVEGGGEVGEDGFLEGRGVEAEDGEGLVAVGGDDDVVEGVSGAGKVDGGRGGGDAVDGGVEEDVRGGEVLKDGVDVGVGTVLEGEPAGTGGYCGQDVVVPSEWLASRMKCEVKI